MVETSKAPQTESHSGPKEQPHVKPLKETPSRVDVEADPEAGAHSDDSDLEDENQPEEVEAAVVPDTKELTAQFKEIADGTSGRNLSEQQEVFRNILGGRSVDQTIQEETEAGNTELVELLEQAQEAAEQVAERKMEIFKKLNAARNEASDQDGPIRHLDREISVDEITKMSRQLKEPALILTTTKDADKAPEQADDQIKRAAEEAAEKSGSLKINKFWLIAAFFAIDVLANQGRGMEALVSTFSHVVARDGKELVLARLGIMAPEDKLDQFDIDYFVGTRTAQEFLGYAQELAPEDLLTSLREIKPKTIKRLFGGDNVTDGYTQEQTDDLIRIIEKRLPSSQVSKLAEKLNLNEDLTPKQDDQNTDD